MSRLPRVTGTQVARALERAGFVLVRVTGSHHHFHKGGVPGLVTVPVHAGEIIPPGTLSSILRQAGLTVEEFLARL